MTLENGHYTPKIFCTGLSRTGTVALCHGLESLGIKVIHYPVHLFIQSERLGLPPLGLKLDVSKYQKWRFTKEKKASYHSHNALDILKTYQCFGDLPIPLFYKQLDRLFPGSLFIHTSRDLDRWLASMHWLYNVAGPLWGRGFVDDELLYQMYGTIKFDQDILRKVFEEHEKDVGLFLENKNNHALSINIDQGELTFDNLARFTGLSTHLSGPVPRLNEPKTPTVAQLVKHHIGRNYLPIGSLWRAIVKRLPNLF